MQSFTTVTGRCAVLERADVDTDQIIPARHLKRIERSGFGQFAFEAWRGQPGFFLGEGPLVDTPFLLAGPNFGCGSSREHAPWALADLGLRALLSPGFADIFRTNCERIGLLPLELEPQVWRDLAERLRSDPELQLEVDLVRRRLGIQGHEWSTGLDVRPEVAEAFLEGRDFIDASLAHREAIERHEAGRPLYRPRTR